MSRKRKALPLIEEAPVLLHLTDRFEGRDTITQAIWKRPMPSACELEAYWREQMKRLPPPEGLTPIRLTLSREGQVLVEVSLKQEAAE